MPLSTKEISVTELKQLLDNEEKLFFVDVRNREDFENWRIEGRGEIPAIHVPYFELLEDADEEDLAKESPLTPRKIGQTGCQRTEQSSRFVQKAELRPSSLKVCAVWDTRRSTCGAGWTHGGIIMNFDRSSRKTS